MNSMRHPRRVKIESNYVNPPILYFTRSIPRAGLMDMFKITRPWLALPPWLSGCIGAGKHRAIHREVSDRYGLWIIVAATS